MLQGGFAVVPPVPVDVAIRQGGLEGEMAGVISQPYYAGTCVVAT